MSSHSGLIDWEEWNREPCEFWDRKLEICTKIVQTQPHSKQEVPFLTKWGTLFWIKILLQVLCAISEFTKSDNATRAWEGVKNLSSRMCLINVMFSSVLWYSCDHKDGSHKHNSPVVNRALLHESEMSKYYFFFSQYTWASQIRLFLSYGFQNMNLLYRYCDSEFQQDVIYLTHFGYLL